jgi:hypothetical protein
MNKAPYICAPCEARGNGILCARCQANISAIGERDRKLAIAARQLQRATDAVRAVAAERDELRREIVDVRVRCAMLQGAIERTIRVLTQSVIDRGQASFSVTDAAALVGDLTDLLGDRANE